MNYQLITAWDKDKLIAKVNAAMDDGWEPQGGISLAVWTDASLPHDEQWELYAQAMVRRSGSTSHLHYPKPALIKSAAEVFAHH